MNQYTFRMSVQSYLNINNPDYPSTIMDWYKDRAEESIKCDEIYAYDIKHIGSNVFEFTITTNVMKNYVKYFAQNLADPDEEKYFPLNGGCVIGCILE